MRRSTAALLLSCSVSLVSPVKAQEAGGSDPQGAVLCIWMINSSILHYGETCRAEQDAPYISTLRRNVERIEAFIFRNSDITPEQLEAYNQRRPSMQGGQCDPDGEMAKVFEMAKQRGNLLDQETDQLLAVERPPVWNPCL